MRDKLVDKLMIVMKYPPLLTHSSSNSIKSKKSLDFASFEVLNSREDCIWEGKPQTMKLE